MRAWYSGRQAGRSANALSGVHGAATSNGQVEDCVLARQQASPGRGNIKIEQGQRQPVNVCEPPYPLLLNTNLNYEPQQLLLLQLDGSAWGLMEGMGTVVDEKASIKAWLSSWAHSHHSSTGISTASDAICYMPGISCAFPELECVLHGLGCRSSGRRCPACRPWGFVVKLVAGYGRPLHRTPTRQQRSSPAA